MGAYLLGVWDLPDEVVEAVAYHHQPVPWWAEEAFGPLAAVHVADALFEGDRGGSPGQELDMSYLRRIGAADRAAIWRGLAASLLETERARRESPAHVTNRAQGRPAPNPRVATAE